MTQIQKGDTTFQIQDELQAKFPELIKLIVATESMDDDERQYWFDIMPSMTDAQIDRLFDILETERKKLQELEVKYQKEIKTLNEKHLIEWQEMQVKEGKKKVEAAKAQDKNDKEEDPDEILAMLNDL
jgi:Spy/CpxP family protein refolding chaperone